MREQSGEHRRPSRLRGSSRLESPILGFSITASALQTSRSEQLTAALAAAEKRLSAAKNEPIDVEKRSRDPRSLYDGNTPIAQVQDPNIDLDQKKVTFPSVSAGVILQAKLYEFQNWKLTCGGTRLYNMVSDGGSREFSYSPLTCKIVGNR